MKIYNLVNTLATVIAVLVLGFCRYSYITSGNDPKKKRAGEKI